MSREVRFSFDTNDQRVEFEEYSKAKGLTLSQFAKMAVFAYKAKYPDKKCKKAPDPSRVAQPYTSEANVGGSSEQA